MSEEENMKEDAEMEVDKEDSSSSDENEDEKHLESRANELEKQISNYAYSYDAHVELVGIYKKLMDLPQMRKAYERFKDLFPLTSKLWLEWLQDEMRVACSDNEKKYILNLFELAVKDYLSVDLWLEYVQYSMGCNTAEDTRKIFECAINESGLHVSKGSLIWDAYREFELAHLACIADSNTEEWDAQAKRVSEIFRRQLSVTLLDAERTYIEWRVWVEKLPKSDFVNKEQIEWGYKNAGKYIDDYKDFEDRLLTDENKLIVYHDYIKYERKPEIIRCLYERAVAESSLDPEIWLEYCMYFFKLDNFDLCVKTCERALRNCPWSENLWAFQIRVTELSKKSHDEITEILEKALSVGFQSGQQYLQVWLAYLEHFRRITDPNNTDSVEKLRTAFQKGYDHITKNFGVESDPDCSLLQLWARIESNLLKNMPECRKIWNEFGILKMHGTKANFWLELIELEKYFGDDKHVRKTYQRALTSSKDWPQCIVQSWLMYERQFGTAESIINCMSTCSKFMTKHEAVQVKEENLECEAQDDKNRKRKHETERQYHKTKQGKVNRDPRKNEKSDVEMKEIAHKKQKNGEEMEKKSEHIEITNEKQSRSVFISNLDYTVTEDELKKFLGPTEELRLVMDRKGNSKGYAYVVFATEDEAQKTLARDREKLSDRPVFISKCKMDKMEREVQFKYSTDTENHKLFVRGLPMTMTEDEVSTIFKQHGDLKQVRLVTYRNGRSKGLAYVEYKNSADAAKAILATDNTEIRGFTITVAISNPPKRKSEETPSVEVPRHSKSRLQIPLVPRALQVATKPTGPTLTNDDFRKMLLNEK